MSNSQRAEPRSTDQKENAQSTQCVACKWTGALASIGCSGFILYKWSEMDKARAGPRMRVLMCSIGLAGLGFYRLAVQ